MPLSRARWLTPVWRLLGTKTSSIREAGSSHVLRGREWEEAIRGEKQLHDPSFLRPATSSKACSPPVTPPQSGSCRTQGQRKGGTKQQNGRPHGHDALVRPLAIHEEGLHCRERRKRQQI